MKKRINWYAIKDMFLFGLVVVLFWAAHVVAADEPRVPAEEQVEIVQESKAVYVVDELVEEVVEMDCSVLLYDVPLDADLQMYIIQTCEDYHIEPSVVMAMIERESSFRSDVTGDSGKSYGLMQIQARWHEDRMERLGVTNLLDPYQNVLVGIDYLAELCGRYECIGMALMAYNAGPSGAKSNYWDKGIYETAYSKGVLTRSEELTEGRYEYVLELD